MPLLAFVPKEESPIWATPFLQGFLLLQGASKEYRTKAREALEEPLKNPKNIISNQLKVAIFDKQ